MKMEEMCRNFNQRVAEPLEKKYEDSVTAKAAASGCAKIAASINPDLPGKGDECCADGHGGAPLFHTSRRKSLVHSGLVFSGADIAHTTSNCARNMVTSS